MANHRDFITTVPALGHRHVPLNNAEFIYLKEANAEIVVTVEDSPVVMAAGDTRSFQNRVDKMELYNPNATDITVTFITGVGRFDRLRLYLDAGFLNTTSNSLTDSFGNTFADTRAEQTLQFIVDNDTEQSFTGGGTIIPAVASGSVSAYTLVDRPGPYFYAIRTNGDLRIHRKSDLALVSTQVNTVRPGDPALGTIGNGFWHSGRGTLFCASYDAVNDLLRFYQLFGSQWRQQFTIGDSETGESSQYASVKFDPYRQELWISINGTNTAKRYIFTGYTPVQLETVTFSDTVVGGGNSMQVFHLYDGRFAVMEIGGSNPSFYDSNYNFISSIPLSAAPGWNVASNGFVDYTSLQVYCCDTGGANMYVKTLETYTSYAELTVNRGVFGSDCANKLAVNADIFVSRAAGYPALSGEVIKTFVQLYVNTINIPEDYLDYVYAFTYNNGVQEITINSGLESFAAAEIGDSFSVDVRYPITLTVRQGLLDTSFAS